MTIELLAITRAPSVESALTGHPLASVRDTATGDPIESGLKGIC